MKAHLDQFLVIIFFLSLGICTSCKKESNPATPTPSPSNKELPTVSTDRIDGISYKAATVVSSVSKDGNSSLTDKGIVYGKNPNPTVLTAINMPNSGNGIGTFNTNLSNLEMGTTYYVRTYATNSVGTAYSEQKTFTTLATAAPTLYLNTIYDILQESAKGGGNITSQGSSPVTERGLVWSTSPAPTMSSPGKAIATTVGLGPYSLSMTGLVPGTKYYVRAFATNGELTGYGNEGSFTTLQSFAVAPTLTTNAITGNNVLSALGGGKLIDQGSSSIVEQGLVWSLSPSPTVSSIGKVVLPFTGIGTYQLPIIGLNPSTQYYIRAYATNGETTGYGNEQSFITLNTLFEPGNGVTDIDGNTYNSIIINGQEWMKENLKVSKYRNGASISTDLSNSQWGSTNSGACSIYGNDDDLYGKLYNWYAVTDSRKLCPAGWHVPTYSEWTILDNYLGGIAIAGGKMKSKTGWTSQNIGATNESDFSGLPGGRRRYDGDYWDGGSQGYWWSTTEYSSEVWHKRLEKYNYESFWGLNDKNNGFSVRCLKD